MLITREFTCPELADLLDDFGKRASPLLAGTDAGVLAECAKRLRAAPSPQQAAGGEAIRVKFDDNFLVEWSDCIPDGEYILAAPVAAVEPTEREKRMQDIGFISPAAAAPEGLTDEQIEALIVGLTAIKNQRWFVRAEVIAIVRAAIGSAAAKQVGGK